MKKSYVAALLSLILFGAAMTTGCSKSADPEEPRSLQNDEEDK